MIGVPPMGGIPPNVRVRMPTQKSQPAFTIHRGVNKMKKPDKPTLRKLLEWGLAEEQKCIGLLKILSPEMVEYDKVNASLSKVQYSINQIRRQM